jgi:hypothetical protein
MKNRKFIEHCHYVSRNETDPIVLQTTLSEAADQLLLSNEYGKSVRDDLIEVVFVLNRFMDGKTKKIPKKIGRRIANICNYGFAMYRLDNRLHNGDSTDGLRHLPHTMNLGWAGIVKYWESPRYHEVLIEHRAGTERELSGPESDYPLKVVKYTSAYGFLPGFTGEDGDPLDAFRGKTRQGEHGCFKVSRPDVESGVETKFFFGLTPDERAEVFATFAPVLCGKPEIFESHDQLEAALAVFQNKEK